MKKNIQKVLVLGSGALKIGEAGEFDYSGSQALKALRDEGIETVLINPNIATVQTSESIADHIYYLPVTPEFVERVIMKERPQGVLLAFGGQTALNCGVELFNKGIFDQYNVEVLGTPVEAIIETEDREIFAFKLDQIGIKTARSRACHSVEEALNAAHVIGYPVICRSAFALGGLGSGFCSSDEELIELTTNAFAFAPQVLVEESLRGWKEIEYEVVRDSCGNALTVCNMENFDPLGIHTGESIVVAPSQTLSNSEYQLLRDLSLRIVEHIGIVGECNVQFALDPHSEDYRVIEMNARLSRSSALASKATGYPLAYVAARLGLGYALHEVENAVTRCTTAFFEPALDYLVVKIPRWDLDKFIGVSKEIGSGMKSVGEVMAIGRSFEEAIQKGLRMIGRRMHGFVANHEWFSRDIEAELIHPTDKRIFVIYQAFLENYSVDRIHQLTGIDKWFLWKLHHIFRLEHKLLRVQSIERLHPPLLLEAKQAGFSDFQIARCVLKADNASLNDGVDTVRALRKKLGMVPFVKQIDTTAAEFPAATNYLYLTYHATQHDISFEADQRSVVVLGSGAYRIGSSVEFDWCAVNALQTAGQCGFRKVMVNFNPETVSTDYDLCDRLYFDELSFERILDIVDLECPYGTIVSVGGQVPNNLAGRLANHGVVILGTSADSIDSAEDRHKFSSLLDSLGIDQPRWKELSNHDQLEKFVDEVGFPVLIRPSYVLSGAAMNVVSNSEELSHFLNLAAEVSGDHPVVISQFIEQAKEIEIDAVASGGEVIAYAISEHVEYAGVHSGDATLVFPPQKIYLGTIRRIKKITRQIARELQISGPFNIQFLARDNDIKVIECNLRASRSFPFVSKVLKINFIELATKVMLGQQVSKPDKTLFDIEYVGVKASQFSFSRLLKADPVLGVEMTSTGEVGCLGDDFFDALLKAMLSVGYRIPKKNVLISSGSARSKAQLLDACRMLSQAGFNLFATLGTSRYLHEQGINSTPVAWPDENGSPNALDLIRGKGVELVVNIPKDHSRNELSNDYTIRRAAIDHNIPLLTNDRLASAFIKAFLQKPVTNLSIKAWDEFDMA
ncbi:MAG: carbamoyl-phosphate synthase (glutamine-hydrolyzing) large subunit [Bacteroidales bacterium]|nr:carbamoyl-phosphate synthase (glutamine-hydrolyzing) large subunit [Bacteroidales bacterium]